MSKRKCTGHRFQQTFKSNGQCLKCGGWFKGINKPPESEASFIKVIFGNHTLFSIWETDTDYYARVEEKGDHIMVK